MLLTGCESITVGPAPRDTPSQDTPSEDTSLDARACASLTRTECMHALHCTLVASGARSYVCRDARGNCEIGLRQIDEDRDRCADREGCAWDEGRCYCPCRGDGQTAVPDGAEARECQCECGGGPPPGCRAR